MEYLFKARKYSRISTLIDTFYLIVAIISTICVSIFFISYDFFSTSGSIIENASEHDLTGGYEVLGGLFLGLFEGMMMIVVIVIIVFFIIQIIFFAISTISGYIALNNFKNQKYTFIADGIIKIALHGSVAAFIVVNSFREEIYSSLWIAIPYIIVVILSVLSITNMNKFNQYNTCEINKN